MRFRVSGLALVGALSLMGAPSAHAGAFKWVDDMFTFREDQKERVSPRHLLPPKEVMVPYYNEKDATQWSNYYTRADLEPETYLTGSASKVMRPANDYTGNNYDTGQNVVIGDPDSGVGMAATGMDGYEAKVTKQATIGAAKKDWREAPADNRLGTSRPGDFDYGWRGQRQLESLADGGEKIAGGTTTGPARGENFMDKAAPAGHDKRYLKFNAKKQVTQYAVQPGDTLGDIAAQPAIYGKAERWPLIYSANRKAIGKNVANLKKGQKLTIPRNYTAAQAKDAEKRAANHPANK